MKLTILIFLNQWNNNMARDCTSFAGKTELSGLEKINQLDLQKREWSRTNMLMDRRAMKI